MACHDHCGVTQTGSAGSQRQISTLEAPSSTTRLDLGRSQEVARKARARGVAVHAGEQLLAPQRHAATDGRDHDVAADRK
jgi:hypothetical protein